MAHLMPQGKKLTMGREVVVSCLISRIHLSALMRAKYPNAEPQMRLSNAVVHQKQVKNISCIDQMAIIFIHNDFKEDEMMMELNAVKCFVKVEQEDPSDFFFEAVGWEMMQTQWVIQQHRKFFLMWYKKIATSSIQKLIMINLTENDAQLTFKAPC